MKLGRGPTQIFLGVEPLKLVCKMQPLVRPATPPSGRMLGPQPEAASVPCWFAPHPNKYPKYDNYNAIEVSRIKDIPYDYEGVMGVPITILGYDLENVEIMGEEVIHNKDTKIEGKEKYRRVLIKKKFEIEGIMSGAKGEELTNGNDGRAKFYVKDKSVYARVLIKKNFEIMQLCASHGKTPRGIENENCYMNGKWKYPRILIRRKTE